MSHSNIDWRLSFTVFRKQGRVSGQEESETVCMSILCTEVTWSVAVHIFGVYIRSSHQKSLNNSKVTTNAGNMKRCSEILSSGVNHCTILDENLNQWSMTLTCCYVKRSPTISICTVNYA